MPPAPFTPRVAEESAHDADSRTDAQLAHILRLLSDNATVVVSGRKMADEIGTTRSAV